jgi:serine/threonine protein kinase/Tfp pilus assembly protein PilF
MIKAGNEPSEADDRLGAIAFAYLQAREQGQAPSEAELLARYPEYAEQLAGFFQGAADFEQLAAPIRGILRGVRSQDASPEDAARPESLPRTLGDYKLIREVGRGGMGIVYEAEQISLGRRVALKVLPFAATLDPRQLQRFKNEARAAAGLHHEHIVPVHGVGCERGVHFYAMQFIDGTTLAELIRGWQQQNNILTDATSPSQDLAANADAATAAGAASPTTSSRAFGKPHYRWAAELIAQAADALEYAHSVGVVHRDIKPGNLILDAAGKLWVTDFGLAKLDAAVGMTLSGDLVGTLRYMSPEQALAKHDLVDQRTDIYSLGATLYELLTLQPAVAGSDKQEVLRRIAFEDAVAPRKIERGIAADLEKIVLKALARDPAERYASAQEFADDLKRWLGGMPVQARRANLRERAFKWVRRRPALAALLAVSCLSLAALLAGLLWHNERLQAEVARTALERDAAREEQRRAAQAVDDMYTRVASEWLGRQPHLQPLQREFLEKALAYYQNAIEHWGDPEVRRKLPDMHFRVGAINAAFGRNRAAEEALHQAIAGFEHVVLEKPGDLAVRNNLLAAYGTLGNVHLATGRVVEAVEAYKRQIGLAGKLIQDFSNRPDFRSRPASARGNLAFALASAGRYTDAEATYQEALLELGRLPADVGNRPEVRNTLAHTHNNLGVLHLRLRRPVLAEPEFRQALAEFKRLAGEDSADPKYRWNLAYTLSNLGASLNAQKRFPEARPFLVQGEEMMGRLAADFPDWPDIQSELAGIQTNLGNALKALGDTRGAEQAYGKAISTLKELAIRFADVPEHHRRLGQAQNNLANLFAKAGRNGAAIETFRQALATMERLTVNFPADSVYQGDLADAVVELGKMLLQVHQVDEADVVNTRAIRLLEKLVAGEPGNLAYQNQLAAALHSEGAVQGEQGRLVSAVAFYRQALKIKPEFHGYLYNLGNALSDLGQYAEAEQCFRRTTEVKPDFAEAYCNLGRVLLRQARFAEALKERRRGNELGRKQKGWPYPSEDWVREAESFVLLEPKLPAVLAGRERFSGTQEQLLVGRLCYYKQLRAAAVRFYAEAFRADPKLAEQLNAHRYEAARAAALAGCGQGKDADKLDAKEQVRLRKQALDWIRAELQAYQQMFARSAAKAAPGIARRMQLWLQDSDFAGVRGAEALGRLPEGERAEWQKFWEEVSALRQRAAATKQP